MNMEPLPLPSDPASNSLLLQGGKVFSRSSSELSSSEGVWLVRKGEKVRENERKCKRAGTPERFPSRNFIHQQNGSPIYSDAWDLNIAQSQAKYQNNQKQ